MCIYYYIEPNKSSRIIKSLFPVEDDRPQLLICYYIMISSDKINLYLLNGKANYTYQSKNSITLSSQISISINNKANFINQKFQ